MSLTKATYSMIDGASWNVLDYGADPTGVADSTTAIRNAIAAAQADQSDFTLPIVEFPKGTYLTTGEIYIEQTPVHLIGNGATIKNTTSNVLRIGKYTNPGPEYAVPAIVEDLVIYGFSGNPSYTGQSAFKGLVIEDSSGAVVRDCTIWGFAVGIYNYGGLVLTFDNVQVRTNVVGFQGLTGTFSLSNFVNFLNCKFYENKQVCIANGGSYSFKNCTAERSNPTSAASITLWDFTNLSGIGGTYCLEMDNVHCEANACDKEVFISFASSNKAAKIMCSNFLGISATYGIQVDNGSVDLDQVCVFNAGTAALQIGGTAVIKDRSCNLQSIGGTTTNYYKELPNGVQINQATWTSGSGTPEGAITAPVGSLYTRTNGGANTTLYVKESGSGNTGWVAK